MRLVRSRARMGRGDMMRRSGITLVSALLALLATGCQVPWASSGQAAGSEQITVAVVPNVGNAPLQVAVKDGLFTEHGVRVTVRTYQTLAQAYAALSSGQADVISGDYAGLLYLQTPAAQARLRLIADGYDAAPGVMEVLTLPGSAIKAPQDLEGQAVATPPRELAPFSANAPYNSETLATEAVLQSDGVSPPSVQWKAMAPSSMISALRDHSVSAIVATQPYILQAETELGAVELLDACSGATASLPLSGYFAAAGFAAGHAAALHDFRSALNAATASTAQLGTVRTVLRTLPGMSSREAALVTIGQYPTFLSVGQVQRVADLMYGTGMITTTISVGKLVFR
ncbi:MAG: NitT/TauT family transport system substrate-binding protein [Streptosporangiaceae bacterium]|jgi:NitT/TauT family transport system substrate-binding protein|nr:NitT/TauT family transport system substrate-binding protein [Streptosporangiaceae bacterium]